MTISQTLRVGDITRDVFARQYRAAGQPVIVSRPGVGWGPIAGWTPGHLVDRLQDQPVRVAVAETGVFDYEVEAGKRFRQATAPFRKAAAEIVKPGRGLYLMQQSIGRTFPQLADELTPPDLLGDEPADAHLWFGSAGNVTPLHYDPLNNLFLQVYGRKRFLLCSPRWFDEVYPAPEDAPFSHISRMDPETSDPDRFPAAQRVQWLEAVLGPGDLLFLPPFWWHHVRSLETSVSVNFWSAPTLAECLTPGGLRLLATVFERDRLETMGAPFRDAALGWLRPAQIAHAHGALWAAVMLAAAAVELPLRALARRESISDRDSKGLRPLAQVNAELLAAGAISADRAAAIGALAPAFERARNRSDDAFTAAEVAEILNAASLLTNDAQTPVSRQRPEEG